MTANGSAKIYEFPARGRYAAAAKRDDSKSSDVVSLRTTKTVSGSGWYHDAAIEESDRTRKN